MAIIAKAFVFVLLFYVINALPVDEQQIEQQNDLLAVESSPEAEVESADGEELTRTKRQCKC